MSTENDLDEVATLSFSISNLLLNSEPKDYLRDVQWHFIDLRVVKFCVMGHQRSQYLFNHKGASAATLTFYIPQHPDVISRHKINGNSLSSESSTTADTVDVVLPVRRQVVVDDQRNLLYVNAASKQVGGDQNTRGSRAEFLHQNLPLLHFHISVLS
jgi:hypothetical protein